MNDIKKIAAVFPGQGSQRTGMGRDFYDHIPACRQTYEEAANALDLDIASICFNEDPRLKYSVSIHALRGGSDLTGQYRPVNVSIHALRGESDSRCDGQMRN